MKTFSVDNQETTTLKAIVAENDLHPTFISKLETLKPNESFFIEITEVKRIK
jgi:hypothetical protein